MRLDRFSGDGTQGKYSIIEHQKGDKVTKIGDPVDDFFVIKLKDIHAQQALLAYSASAQRAGDKELAHDVYTLAQTAGPKHPHAKAPD